jgi:hypothetical protein
VILVVIIVALAVLAWFLLWRDHGGGTASPSSGVTGGGPSVSASAPGDTSAPADTSTPDDTSTPEDTSTAEESAGSAANEQASAVDQVIAAGKPSRGALGPALQQVRDCTSVDEGLATIRRVAQSRHDQGLRAEALTVDAIDGGESIKRLLVDALDASERADRAYLRWAQRYAGGGCAGAIEGDRDYKAGNAASAEATASKAAFVTAWNPIAEQEGLPTRREPEI